MAVATMLHEYEHTQVKSNKVKIVCIYIDQKPAPAYLKHV